MKLIGFVKADTRVAIINWIGVPLFFVYVISMFIVPLFEEGWDWAGVQNVWDRWQALNVGALALSSSVIAFNIAKYNSDKQRARQFVAARAFLPHALSELTSYCKSSAKLLKEAWERGGNLGAGSASPLEVALPELPESYKETFSRCIGEAEPDVGDYLARILMRLQIHHSRLLELRNSFSPGSRTLPIRENTKSYLYSLAELQALINKLFGFARGSEPFDGSDLVWEDYRNAYGNLDIWVEEVDDLQAFTLRAIERKKSNQNS
jgi:hypothetical protein